MFQLPGVLSPTSGRENRDDSSFFSSSDISQNNVDDEIEGFLCPICMVHFNSPESLSEHFEEAHNKVRSFRCLVPPFISHFHSPFFLCAGDIVAVKPKF